MSVPGRMTLHTLHALKGWSANMNALDFHAKLSANVTFTVNPGRVLHLNSSGELETGASGYVMPLHNFYTSTDPSITIDGGTASSDVGAFVPIVPVGQMMVLVGSGPYELSSTEYDTNGSYSPNTPLKAIVANSTAATGGTLAVGIAGTDTIVGCVSRGVISNGYGANSLAFWTVFHPVL